MNTQLVISLDKARELYPKASSELKVILDETFGKNNLKSNVTERVKSVQDACYELRISYVDFITSLRGLSPDTYAYECLKMITKALNGEWKVDYLDKTQQRWFPRFTLSSSGFAFLAASYIYSYPSAGGASRLLFKNKETAEYAGKKFIDLYRVYLT